MKNFIQIQNALITDSKISDSSLRTYLILKTFKYGKNSVFPSQETLAKRRGKSKKSIITHLKKLRSLGLILYKKRGFSASNQYIFIGEENYNNEKGLSVKTCTSEVKKTAPQLLQNLQPNNNELNNTKSNNIDEEKDRERRIKKSEQLRKIANERIGKKF